MKNEIVVARYNENIEWLLPYKEICTVYNKGNNDEILNSFKTIKLENVGRESHTYLYHIINNYDNLADKTVFFQGEIDDHNILNINDYLKEGHIIGKFTRLNIENLKKKINHSDKYKNDKNMKMCNYTPYEWIKYIIGIDIRDNTFSKVIWGANFSLSKEIILLKPKIFYENIIKHVDCHINPEEGHYLERSWYLIFTMKLWKNLCVNE